MKLSKSRAIADILIVATASSVLLSILPIIYFCAPISLIMIWMLRSRLSPFFAHYVMRARVQIGFRNAKHGTFYSILFIPLLIFLNSVVAYIGITMIVFSWGIGFFASILVADSHKSAENIGLQMILSVVFGIFSILVGLFIYCRSVFRLYILEVKLKANRKPATLEDVEGQVLYLRSFDDDYSFLQLPYGSFFTFMLTDEEKMVKTLSKNAKVFAIGKPGEALPPIGASRLYFEEDEWKLAILKMLRTSAIVLVRPNLSAGLRWELRSIKKLCSPEKVIIYIGGGTSKSMLNQFKSLVQNELGIQLPDKVTTNTYVTFDTGWDHCSSMNENQMRKKIKKTIALHSK